MILCEVPHLLTGQVYLTCLYRAILVLGYYGLMRVGELTQGTHPVKSCNVHIGSNKNKILIVLYSSKTHSRVDYPQQIKISASQGSVNTLICPFKVVRDFLQVRDGYNDNNENFFIFSDGTSVKPDHFRKILADCIDRLNLNSKLYGMQSLRSGRACDLLKAGLSVEDIKRIGHWKSNAVYKYLRYVNN